MLVQPEQTKTPMTGDMGIPVSRLSTPKHVANLILEGIPRH